eukprot:CAMPEP_0171476924 /NCGR_PEP_ID=MMETSP0946-20130122/3883_1 /TAXON_ID=109269 /ORGANISM="Vaucheria litorea, Strain CCMP2940" /LENGTH=492 /DNA_ID=CAMNT_0012007285 /DNA_START=38 /DNA_END=1516 /DNA_ORIENTATION=-
MNDVLKSRSGEIVHAALSNENSESNGLHSPPNIDRQKPTQVTSDVDNKADNVDSVTTKRSSACGSTDENPNGICRFDAVNIGGPGWFNDVFDLSLEFDTALRFKDTPTLSLVPPTSYKRWVPLIDAHGPIKGKVTLHPPPGRTVWTYGIKVAVEEHLLLLESAGSELLCSATIDVAPGQYIEETKSFPFTLPLESLDRDNSSVVGLRESYVGDMLALRHQMVVKIQRPWYTFNVISQVPIFVQRVIPPPSPQHGPIGPNNEEGGPNTVVVIPDCNGRAELSLESDGLDVEGVIKGAMTYVNLNTPISGAHIVIIRTETIGGNMFESVVGEHTFLGESGPGGPSHKVNPPTNYSDSNPNVPVPDEYIASPYVEYRHPEISSTREKECMKGPIICTGQIKVELPLAKVPLTPTMPFLGPEAEGNDGEESEDTVGVRYFLRLILEEMAVAGGMAPSYWNTHEVFFFRSRLSPGNYESEPQIVSEDESSDHSMAEQ